MEVQERQEKTGKDGKDGEDYVLTELDKAEISNMTAQILQPTIPKKTSDLTNDSDFTTKTYVDGLVGDINTALESILGGGN